MIYRKRRTPFSFDARQDFDKSFSDEGHTLKLLMRTGVSPSRLSFAEDEFHVLLIRSERRLGLCVNRIENFDVQLL